MGGAGAPTGHDGGTGLLTGSVFGGGACTGNVRALSATVSSGTARRREVNFSAPLRAPSLASCATSPLSSQWAGRLSTADLHATLSSRAVGPPDARAPQSPPHCCLTWASNGSGRTAAGVRAGGLTTGSSVQDLHPLAHSRGGNCHVILPSSLAPSRPSSESGVFALIEPIGRYSQLRSASVRRPAAITAGAAASKAADRTAANEPPNAARTIHLFISDVQYDDSCDIELPPASVPVHWSCVSCRHGSAAALSACQVAASANSVVPFSLGQRLMHCTMSISRTPKRSITSSVLGRSDSGACPANFSR